MRIFTALSIFLPYILTAQTAVPTLLGTLDPQVNETSGLEKSSAGGFWTHNDSGGDPELYQIDLSGNIVRTLRVWNATNVDWEDLTRDASGRMYIGDFGNNNHNRTNLKIYRIPDPDGITADSVEAQLIEFDYPDQTLFPPPAAQQNFDCESMIHFGGSLYLFSKNWTDPFTGQSKIYRLPQTPGIYTAQLIDSIYTGPGPALSDWLTSAAVSPDRQTLALLSYDGVYLYTCRNKRSFPDAPMQFVAFSGFATQREGIVFTSNTEIAFTEEELFIFPANLYAVDLSTFIPVNCCEEPTLLSPVSSFPGEALLTWDDVTGADAYRVYLKKIGSSVQTQIVTSPVAFFTGLDSAADYRAAVQAKCGVQISNLSDTVVILPGLLKSPPVPEFVLSPNPATEYVSVQGNLADGLQWMLRSSDGRFVSSGTMRANHIDLPKITAGIYILELQSETRLSQHMLMIR